MAGKKTKKAVTTSPNISNVTWDAKSFDLGAIRENFDGLRDVAKNLPEGDHKKTLMSKIEDAYVGMAHAFKQFTGIQTPV